MMRFLFGIVATLIACTPSEPLPTTCSPACPSGQLCVNAQCLVAADSGTDVATPDAPQDAGGLDAVMLDSGFDVRAQDDPPPDRPVDTGTDVTPVDLGVAETESDTGVDVPADVAPDAISCPMGRADCDGIGANGCEIDVQTDRLNCGRCTNVCVNPDNAMGVCSAGACNLRCIGSTQMNCDGMIANGCEADTRNDARNCGGCGVSCGARSCVMGRCN